MNYALCSYSNDNYYIYIYKTTDLYNCFDKNTTFMCEITKIM